MYDLLITSDYTKSREVQWPKGWNLHSTLDEMVFDHRLLPATAFYWIILPLQQFVIILDLLLAEEVTQE